MRKQEAIALAREAFALDGQLGATDIGADWVVWERHEEIMFGALRYVVSKDTRQVFAIPSSCGASTEAGVCCAYEVIVTGNGPNPIMLARLLAQATGLTSVEILATIKRGLPAHLGVFFLQGPLRLGKEIVQAGGSCLFIRPDNRGSYRCGPA